MPQGSYMYMYVQYSACTDAVLRSTIRILLIYGYLFILLYCCVGFLSKNTQQQGSAIE